MTSLLFILIIITIIFLIERLFNLSKKVDRLIDEVNVLRNNFGKGKTAQIESLRIEKSETKVILEKKPREVPLSGVKRTPEKPEPKIKTKKTSRTREQWEALIGEKLLNRVGALALIFALGFFLKYAFDNDWITESLRVFIGIFLGSFLLLAGARFNKKGFDIFAQGLIGAGISALYLSVYASFNYYHLLPQAIAFFVMSIVTAITFWQALRYNSLAISILGWAGGFLTPFLLSTGESNEIGLFSYICLLDIAILAILLKKNLWIILQPLTVAATYIIFLLWFQEYYTDQTLWLTTLFISIFWVMFYVMDLLWISKTGKRVLEIRLGVATFNTVIYYALLYRMIDSIYPAWMGLVTLLLAAVYFISYLLISKQWPQNDIAQKQYSLVPVILLIIATDIQFSKFVLSLIWSAEALFLCWWGGRKQLTHIWRMSLLLLYLSLFHTLLTKGSFEYDPLSEFSLVFNLRSMSFILWLVVSGLVLVILKSITDKRTEIIKNLLRYSWAIVLFFLCTVETIDYFKLVAQNASQIEPQYYIARRFLILTLVWMVYSLPIANYGLLKKKMPFVYCGYTALFLAVLEASIRGIKSYYPLSDFTLLFNFRAFILVLVVIGIVIHYLLLIRTQIQNAQTSTLMKAMGISAITLIFVLLSRETFDYFEKIIYLINQNTQISTGIDHFKDQQQLSLSAVWLIYSIILMSLGIWRRSYEIRISAIGLFGITIVKIFIYDLSFLETLYRIFSFLALGLILLIVSYLYSRYKQLIVSKESS